MKKLILLLILVPVFAQAQNQGEVIYLTKVTMQFNMDGDHAGSERIKELMSQQREFKNVLYFKDGVSLYLPVKNNEPEEIRHTDGNAEFVVKMTTPDNQIYHDLNNHQKIESREFLGKYFLITGEPEKLNWKLTGAMKTIAGYSCQEATFADSAQTISAWFTPEIPVSLGPDNYGQLPGLIMSIDIDNGKRIIEVSEIKLAEIDDTLIQVPDKGKKVTDEEFEKIVDKKMKEMGGTRGKGGVRMIVTEEIN